MRWRLPNRRRWVTIAIIAGWAGMAAPAGAGGGDRLRLRGFFGARTFSSNGRLGDSATTTLSNSATFGPRLQIDLFWKLVAEAELPMLITSTRDDRATVFVFDPRLLVAVNFDWHPRIKPLLLFGGGLPTALTTDSDVLRSPHAVPEAFFGIGARFERKQGFSIRLDIRTNLVRERGTDSRIAPELEVLLSVYRRRPPKAEARAEIAAQKVADRDGDGVPDGRDRCPDRAEDKDGFEDQDGCPDIDDDGDEILDIVDKCRQKPETRNGYQDDDGCPDRVPATVRRYVGVLRGVKFRRGSARLRGSSHRYLRGMAAMLKKYPSVRGKLIGHADDSHDPDRNQQLALARADAVSRALVAMGISAYRMMVLARGEQNPPASARHRGKKRRVELQLWAREK